MDLGGWGRVAARAFPWHTGMTTGGTPRRLAASEQIRCQPGEGLFWHLGPAATAVLAPLLPATRRRAATLLVAAGLLLPLAAARAGAQEGRAAILTTPDGEREVRVLGWTAAGPRVAGARPGGEVVRDWLELRLPAAGSGAPEAEAIWRLELTGGGWLRGLPSGGDADRLTWRLAPGARGDLDLLWVRRLGRGRLPTPAGAEGPDRLWLDMDGSLDERRGWLLGLWEAGLDFEGPGGESRHPWSRVLGLALTPEETPRTELQAWVVLAGERGVLPAVRIRELGERLVLETPWQATWELPAAAVVSLHRRSAPVRDLTEMAPEATAGPGGPVLSWRPWRHRSVEGRPLRVAGRVRPTGWGTRAPARILLGEVGPGTLRVRVGVDDEVAGGRRRQPVVFRILRDGRELARTPPVEYGEPPRLLVVALPERGPLELRTEVAGGGPSTGAHGDWLEPLLLPLEWPELP